MLRKVLCEAKTGNLDFYWQESIVAKQFSISQAFKKAYDSIPRVPRARLLTKNNASLKAKVISWLTSWKMRPTLDRLQKWGI